MSCIGTLVKESHLPQQQSNNGHKFPLVLSPMESDLSLEATKQWLHAHSTDIEASLTKHGAILFRGFPVKTPEDFYEFLKTFQWRFGSYAGGGGPRKVIVGPIHTSTETPPDHYILVRRSFYLFKLIIKCINY